MGSDQEGSIVQWTKVHDVAFQKAKVQDSEDVGLRYAISQKMY